MAARSSGGRSAFGCGECFVASGFLLLCDCQYSITECVEGDSSLDAAPPIQCVATGGDTWLISLGVISVHSLLPRRLCAMRNHGPNGALSVCALLVQRTKGLLRERTWLPETTTPGYPPCCSSQIRSAGDRRTVPLLDLPWLSDAGFVYSCPCSTATDGPGARQHTRRPRALPAMAVLGSVAGAPVTGRWTGAIP